MKEVNYNKDIDVLLMLVGKNLGCLAWSYTALNALDLIADHISKNNELKTGCPYWIGVKLATNPNCIGLAIGRLDLQIFMISNWKNSCQSAD